ncbi:unnamed protein product [Leptosia nina]|uniref:Uncharacterized protein n=1 Tax=Leptosia nina TaxID=320188 RepID=A0AAV1J2X4_9NEOP
MKAVLFVFFILTICAGVYGNTGDDFDIGAPDVVCLVKAFVNFFQCLKPNAVGDMDMQLPIKACFAKLVMDIKGCI